MRVVIDTETDSLTNPTKVWLVVCKDIDKGDFHVFRNPSENSDQQRAFLAFCDRVELYVGHNWLEFDYPQLSRLLGLAVDDIHSRSLDTLILSRLFNFTNPHAQNGSDTTGAEADGEDTGLVGALQGKLQSSHSIEAYGAEFGIPKLEFNDFTRYSLEMEEYCVRDVDISHRIYCKYRSYIDDPAWQPSIELEHRFQAVVNDLHTNGFSFNVKKSTALLDKVKKELGELDAQIKEAFPARLVFVKEIHPRITKYGTLHRQDFRWISGGNLSEFSGDPFCRLRWQEFNPASHRQVVAVLNRAGWKPIDKTQTHLKTKDPSEHLKTMGWKVNENNLTTLPHHAPKPARLLARRILLESRRRTLTEWLGLCGEDGRIHGKFYGIGAWTGRMAHQKPNTANIPNELDTQGQKKLLGKEMRALWQAPKGRLLVGVDAEGIQLRIFAHYIDDKEFTDALVSGKKSDKTDPHSLNQRILGNVCKSRAAAKRFIYALLLGAGIWKLSQILDCSESECKAALDRLLQRYSGWATLKKKDIPRDAKRGYFIGLDNRRVYIPGGTFSERKHLAMSGYLQSGEAIAMKLATTLFYDKLKDYDATLVNLVHDEWQTEAPNNIGTCLQIAALQSESLRIAGERLKLGCPLIGSYYNDDIGDYTIGTNWSVTH